MIKIITDGLNEKCIADMAAAIEGKKVFGIIYNLRIPGATIEDVQDKVRRDYEHFMVTKFVIPSGDLAYYLGFHPLTGAVEIARSDREDMLVTCENPPHQICKLFEMYDAAAAAQPITVHHLVVPPCGTDWREYVSDILGVIINEADINERISDVPKGAPSNFVWMAISDPKYTELENRVEDLKKGWKIINILSKVNVTQSPENLAYWHPLRILRFFGVIRA